MLPSSTNEKKELTERESAKAAVKRRQLMLPICTPRHRMLPVEASTPVTALPVCSTVRMQGVANDGKSFLLWLHQKKKRMLSSSGGRGIFCAHEAVSGYLPTNSLAHS